MEQVKPLNLSEATMWRLLLVPALLTTVVVAHTQAPNPNKQAEAPLIWNGNSLFDLCKGYKANKLAGRLSPGCFFYIAGVTQTVFINVELKTMPPICPGKHVTQAQIVDVVTKWLDDHSEKRDLRAPILIWTALVEAFPCS